MSKLVTLITLTLLLSTFAFGSTTDPIAKYTPGSVIVKLKNNSSPASLAQSLPGVLGTGAVEPLFKNINTDSKSKVQLSDFYILQISEALDARQAAAEISLSALVEYAQPNYLHQLHGIPNDPDFSAQPFLNQISAAEAWDITHGDSNVVIAILDTGVDWDHPDLADDIWTNEGEIPDDGIDNDFNGKVDDVRGWDFVNNASNAAISEDGEDEDNDPSDYNGHGTHVAGLAAAVTDNGVGVSGGGWNCEIMPLRVGYETTDGTGSIQTSAVLKALQYSVDNGASVLNASFGGPFNDFAERDMMRYAFDNGVVVVKSAGNSNSDIGYSPDNEDFVLSVAAVRNNDIKAAYSNFGDWVKISAPGGNRGIGLRSTYPDDSYNSIWGTSMSGPVAAGIAGLVKSVHPDWTAAQVMMHLVDTADNIDAVNPLYVGQLGNKGRVNAFRAVAEPFASMPEFEIAKISIQDLLHNGNGDQRVNIGETADLLLRLRNRWSDAENVSIELTSDDPFVTIEQPFAFFASIPGVSSKNNFAENITDMFTIAVDSTAFPHNLKFQLNITADGGFSETLDFQMALEARLLFVDDDDGVRNVENYYFEILDSLGMPYDVWDYATQGRTGSLLRRYDIVIWSCENALPTLLNEDRADLQTYLRANRHLFIAGQNIGWDLSATQSGDEAQAMNYFNQLNMSNGRSKTFYENYLHSRFEQNKSSYSYVEGVEGELISQGLEFAVEEPLREIVGQSPDVISKGTNADIVFEYPDGTGAAIKHESGAKVVNFAFGGIEAISDEKDRLEVMSRLLDYFTGIQLNVLGVDNVENISGDFIVRASVKSVAALESINLYWRTLNSATFTKTAMTAVDDSIYSAPIPRQPVGTEIEYAVQAVKTDGVYTPVQLNHLTVASTAPNIAGETLRRANLSRKPYVLMKATDDSGVDTTNTRVIFWSTTTDKDSTVLDYLGDDAFGGIIDGNFSFGDSMYYQFAANDMSPNTVRGLSPVYSMKLGFEDFEFGLDAWIVGDGEWGLNSSRQKSGQYSIHESGDNANTLYPNNADLAITLKEGLDLSNLSEATLSIWTQYAFFNDKKDFGQVEASNDSGETWTPLGLPIEGFAPRFYNAQFSLDAFTGSENENVLFRFRLMSDANNGGPGWFIDDISILTVSTGITKTENELPREFRLEDNYPNPFNAGTKIRFALPQDANVKLAIYNTLGQEIRSLTDQALAAGVHTLVWDGLNNEGTAAPSGIYFYRMSSDDFTAVKKLTMIK
jgi:subtilisin family serine protease